MMQVSAFESQGEPGASSRHARWAFALGAALALSAGCVTVGPDLGSQPPELAGPFPTDYVELVRRWIDSDFYDVSTVMNLQVSKPIAGQSKSWPSGKRLYGWYAKVTFKARDSVGASKGKLAYAILMRDGEVVSSRKLLY